MKQDDETGPDLCIPFPDQETGRTVTMSGLTREFFHTLPRNILRSFWGRNLLWHLLAIITTVIIVTSGFDWLYFKTTRPFARYLFPAVFLGWLVPVVFPIASFAFGIVRKDRRAVRSAYAAAQAAVIGLLIASFYKALTGRPGLRHAVRSMVDTSREFRFGFLKGGVFFGWPSSHTTVAFAMAAAVWTLYPDSRVTRCAAALYALYVGIGVSMTIHWFSDFFAGAIIGTVIGLTVGKVFMKSLHHGSRK
ncbi:MAG: phosphatase PAP2 family protein [Candidatus Sulfobium sp.]|jgi:membrane-associated phospholipid phosphatase